MHFRPLSFGHVRAHYRRVARLTRMNRAQLAAMPRGEFRNAWSSVCFVFPGLHPDSALDHGTVIRVDRGVQCAFPEFVSLVARYFERSGWPVALIGAAAEAWRRYTEGELSDDEFYDAVSAMDSLFGKPFASTLDRSANSAKILK